MEEVQAMPPPRDEPAFTCPNTNEGSGCTLAQISISPWDIRQIKSDLGKYSGNPDNYIEGFQRIKQIFVLFYQDLIFLLEQTLSHTEKEILAEA